MFKVNYILVRNAHRHSALSPHPSAAFTLIELLVVVAIIVLLIGISLGVLLKARGSAKQKTVQAQLNAIETGLNAYKQDFNRYPASRVSYPDLYDFPGAVLLVDALLGPEGKGFQPTGSNKTYGPYLEVKSNQLQIIDEGGSDSTGDGSDINQYTADQPKYVFMDAFGRHILYYKATRGVTGVGNVYDHTHNTDAGNNWKLRIEGIDYDLTHKEPDDKMSDQIWDNPGFRTFIYDPLSTNELPDTDDDGMPYNSSSYLLITAGPDKRFGTADDICNFEFDDQKNLIDSYQ